jgi:hypothetical protein
MRLLECSTHKHLFLDKQYCRVCLEIDALRLLHNLQALDCNVPLIGQAETHKEQHFAIADTQTVRVCGGVGGEAAEIHKTLAGRLVGLSQGVASGIVPFRASEAADREPAPAIVRVPPRLHNLNRPL